MTFLLLIHVLYILFVLTVEVRLKVARLELVLSARLINVCQNNDFTKSYFL